MLRENLKACLAVRCLVKTRFAAPVFLLGAVALAAWVHDQQEPVSAFAVLLPDADNDGIRDEFERSMFTSMDTWDSDGDTWSDAEEFSMQTNPGNALRYPVTIPRLSTNLTARGESNRIHILSTAYFRDAQNQANAQFELGVLIGRRYRKFSSNYLALFGESHSVAARPAGAQVAFFEISFPDTLLAPGERATFLAMLTLPGSAKPVTVTTLDVIKDISGVMMMDYPTEMMPTQPGTNHPLPSGTIYLPIPTTSSTGGGSIPQVWTPSMLCLKRTVTVGKVGALLTQEVVAADCIVGFEGYCSPAICSNTVGDSFQTIDPLALVGAQ